MESPYEILISRFILANAGGVKGSTARPVCCLSQAQIEVAEPRVEIGLEAGSYRCDSALRHTPAPLLPFVPAMTTVSPSFQDFQCSPASRLMKTPLPLVAR